jgi:diguanylate cyclase (GGDEF)-like protein
VGVGAVFVGEPVTLAPPAASYDPGFTFLPTGFWRLVPRRMAGRSFTDVSPGRRIPVTVVASARLGGPVRLTSHGQKSDDRLHRKSPLPEGWAALCIVSSLLFVFWLDRVTGSAPVQHLYYAPIILSAIVFGHRGGLVAAMTAVVLYHVANPVAVSLAFEEKDVVQVALFLGVGLVTAKLMSNGHRMRALAMTDDLTGLHNLRSFESRLATMLEAAAQAATAAPFSLLVLDVDRLKSLNDRHGHLTGAEAVRAVGRTIAASVPADAIACRYGGDEFVVALPQCGEVEALRIARIILESVNAAAPVLAGRQFPPRSLSVSVGISCRLIEAQAGSVVSTFSAASAGEALFRAADAALYAAKNGGRNRVELDATAGRRRRERTK